MYSRQPGIPVKYAFMYGTALGRISLVVPISRSSGSVAKKPNTPTATPPMSDTVRAVSASLCTAS